MVELERNRMLVALAQMPKAELHLHLEGAPRWSTLRDLQRTPRQRLFLSKSPDSRPRRGGGEGVTVNSDDSTWFGLNLTQEMQRLVGDRQVSLDCVARWRRNAFEVAIANEAMRSQFFS